MWSADDKALERALDEVAREMTAGDPDAGLRARVMARLEGRAADEDRATRIPSWAQTRWAWTRVAQPASVWRRHAWMAAPAAVAIAVLLAVFLMRDRRMQTPADTVPTVAQSGSPAPAAGERPTPQRADAEPTPRAVQSAGGRNAAQSAPRLSARAASAPTARPSEVAALAPPPLAMPSIQLNAIDPAASIALPRLNPIEPITVTPIGEPQGERP